MTRVAPSIPPGWPRLSLAEAHRRLIAPGSPFEVESREIRGVPIRVWKHALPNLRDVLISGTQSYPERTLLVYEDERVTMPGFARAVATLAQALQREGLRKGERVAIAMRNLPEWAVAYFAVVVSGAIATPLNAWWSSAELAYALQDAGCALALVDGERYARVEGILAGCSALRRVFVTRAEEAPRHRLACLLADVLGPSQGWEALPERALPEVAIEPDDDATIFYTSGTTGRSKGAIATHRNITTNILTQMFALSRPYVRRGEIPPLPQPGDAQRVTLLGVPFFHVTGCNSTLVPALNSGAKVVLMRKWDAEQALALIERERVTAAGGVPTIAWQLLEHPNRDKYDLSSLTTMAYGGAPSAPELVRRIKSNLPQVAPGNSWGMTETSGTFTSNYAEDYILKPDSCGVPPPVGEVKVIGEAGDTLAPNAVGELWARGPQVVRGYWGMPEETAENFCDGWCKTGDLARIDDEGFVYIVDRKKDILIRGGENIYCIQVESALYEHPAVMDAAVVGIAHRTLGEEPGAIVHLKPGAKLEEAELRAFVGERLAAFEVPVRILFWPEPLPRNQAGKIMKRELRSAF
jgi:long-chain acyl-CoA synthetase